MLNLNIQSNKDESCRIRQPENYFNLSFLNRTVETSIPADFQANIACLWICFGFRLCSWLCLAINLTSEITMLSNQDCSLYV